MKSTLLGICLLLVVSATEWSRPAIRTPLCALRGGAGRRKHKAMHLHDIARNDSQNEYYAGGLDEEGRGSATVLIYPDEDKMNVTEAAPPPPPPEKFKGTGRSL